MNNELRAFFDRLLPAVDRSLDSLLPPETASPSEIHQAMRYSIFAGGKRLRPALCVAGYLLGRDDSADWKAILPVACAFEMVHTYSLIHDDLPAMDDDDFRRGRPSCHKKFNEAIAILAGDALLTFAFEVLSRCDAFPSDRMVRVISMISHALGTEGGMIAGQVLDLEGERRPATDVNIEQIHRSKTAALISAAVTTGAFLGGVADGQIAHIRMFGDQIGLAFQIVDDILDEISTTAELGKTGGKDRQQHKATYPALYGLDKSREIAAALTAQARVAIRPLGDRARTLGLIADYLETRSH
jgi:geranylgeranyl diphosphate synthase, type II